MTYYGRGKYDTLKFLSFGFAMITVLWVAFIGVVSLIASPAPLFVYLVVPVGLIILVGCIAAVTWAADRWM